MYEFFNSLTVLPGWALLLSLGVLIAVVILGVLLLGARWRIRALIRRLGKDQDEAEALVKRYLPLKSPLIHSHFMRQIARRHDINLPMLSGVDKLWLARLQKRPNAKTMRHLLEFSPDSSIFACFKAALDKPRLGNVFKAWLDGLTDFLPYRQIAAAGRGEDFDGRLANEFFTATMDQIREMTGDLEWPSRYFAIKTLIHDPEPRSQRAVQEAFSDSHALVRKTVVAEATAYNREEFYTTIKTLYLDDPVYEVRQAARQRLEKDFNDLFVLDYASLTPVQAGHILELLDPARDEDINLATQYLAGDEPELHFAAALFLERSGSLQRLFTRASLEDMPDFDRVKKLLGNASSVNINSFLGGLEEASKGSLFLAAELLAKGGDRAWLLAMWEQIQGYVLKEPLTAEDIALYSAGLDALSLRGPDAALSRLGSDLLDLRSNLDGAGASLMPLVLERLPERADNIFCPILLGFLSDGTFPLREPLRAALARMPHDLVLPGVMHIIREGRASHSHTVRMDALRVLGDMRLPYCVQLILEHLPTLPQGEIKEFSRLLAETDNTLFEERAASLLASADASVRAGLIAGLPSTGRKTFIKEIREALEDADPDVRIAAVWALVEYDDTKTLGQAASMLRDPLERVRSQVGRALGSHGTEASLKKLEEALADPNEVPSVRLAALEGLAISDEKMSTEIMARRLAQDDSLGDDIERFMARKTQAKFVKQLVELFKDAKGDYRKRLCSVFKIMGTEGETAMVDLLEEDIASLKPFIADIIESTGQLESWIRKLGRREPKVRRDAAAFLARIGTAAAFRGMVLAARDPDQEVRVQVAKALEVLNTPDGATILEQLRADPDKRVRTYTEWALERTKAKNLT